MGVKSLLLLSLMICFIAEKNIILLLIMILVNRIELNILGVIKDIVTGEVLGDHLADRMTKELVINAILAMLARHNLEEGCIFHSDRGTQYTSHAVMDLLKQYGLCQSFSRVGMPADNAWVGKFLCHHEERTDPPDALRNQRFRKGSGV
jgi:hypothetical protein